MPEDEKFDPHEAGPRPEQQENYFSREFETLYYPGAGSDLRHPLQFFDAQTYIFSDRNLPCNTQYACDQIEALGHEIVKVTESVDKKSWEIEFRKQKLNETGNLSGEFETQTRKIIYNGRVDVSVALSEKMQSNDLLYLNGFFPLTGSVTAEAAEKFYENVPTGAMFFTTDMEPFRYHFFGMESNEENTFDFVKKRELTSDEFQRAYRLSEAVRELSNCRDLISIGRDAQEAQRKIIEIFAEVEEIKKHYSQEEQDLIESVISRYR